MPSYATVYTLWVSITGDEVTCETSRFFVEMTFQFATFSTPFLRTFYLHTPPFASLRFAFPHVTLLPTLHCIFAQTGIAHIQHIQHVTTTIASLSSPLLPSIIDYLYDNDDPTSSPSPTPPFPSPPLPPHTNHPGNFTSPQPSSSSSSSLQPSSFSSLPFP